MFSGQREEASRLMQLVEDYLKVHRELERVRDSFSEREGENSFEVSLMNRYVDTSFRVFSEWVGLSSGVELQQSILVPEDSSKPSLYANLGVLKLPARVSNSLYGLRYHTVGEVLALERGELLKIRNFGPKSLAELIEALEREGYEVPVEWCIQPVVRSSKIRFNREVVAPTLHYIFNEVPTSWETVAEYANTNIRMGLVFFYLGKMSKDENDVEHARLRLRRDLKDGVTKLYRFSESQEPIASKTFLWVWESFRIIPEEIRKDLLDGLGILPELKD